MANLKNVIGGHKAKNAGRLFENELVRQAMIDGIGFEKIPSGCEWRRTAQGVKPIPVKTPFDFVMVRGGKAVFFDAKSVEGETFPYSKLEHHQVDSLAQIAKHGFKCGYMVKFEGIGLYWFSVEKLLKLNPRESLKPSEGQSLMTSTGSFNLVSLFL